MIQQELNWVCVDCATSRGAKIPEYHSPTFHDDICDLCHRYTQVTEPRDFGRSRHLLYTKVKDIGAVPAVKNDFKFWHDV